MIPKTWNDVTLSQFQGYLEALKGRDRIDQTIKIVAAVCQISIERVYEMEYAECFRVAGKIGELMNTPRRGELQTFIKVGDTTYGLHPNIYGMSTGEYIDLSGLAPDFWSTAHKAMAILYRPVVKTQGEKYEIEKYSVKHFENANLFLTMPMPVVEGLAAFFLDLSNESGQILTTYFLNQAKTLTQQARQILGGGIEPFTTSQGVTS
jgi:hypothetical protein